jgi:hypothetical protein
MGQYMPPSVSVRSPGLWGTKAYLKDLAGCEGSVAALRKTFVFRYRSPERWIEIFPTYYGPMRKAFAAIDQKARAALENDLRGLIREFNLADDGTGGRSERVSRSGHHQGALIKRGGGPAQGQPPRQGW